MAKQSLRDLKKEETWHVLAQTSFELALEKGLDGFTIEDVVQRAHYSRRTFANHFSCKEEAVAMSVISVTSVQGEKQRAEVLQEVDKISEESPVDALYQWLRMNFTANLLRKLRQLFALSKSYPTLEPYVLNVLHRLQEAGHFEVKRVCGDRYPLGYPHLLVGAVFGAVLSILEEEVPVRFAGEEVGEDADKQTNAIPFDQFLEMTFGYLKNGF
ncbi:TetR/AcrR family transcriptional regulator [Saccharibacillus sp. JS10]|uniref:TetR/AcrR family transcriptional regulator n=1 Tax=Saccharibacillus sp. JS10 TaxID=2950552 RepID=UPI00210A1822|nr:TetR/AcrR family transcriptional regulator [Saccharibacillus sp. JS10]MCQ4087645.1 TetR/AcrR family transcriptional regulator [Saccharibacillus sp. JS10]